MRSFRASSFALLPLLCLAATPVQAVSFSVGYADSDSDDRGVNSPFWAGANVTRSRMCVSYNVASKPVSDPERVNFQNYLATAQSKGIEVMASLMNDKNSPMSVPSTSAYDTALASFLGAWPNTTYPQLAIIGPWNEPNFEGKGQPTPANAAMFARMLDSRTGRVKIPGEWAGPEDSTAGRNELGAEIEDYLYYLRDYRPGAFGYHAWTDMRKYQASSDNYAQQTRFFINRISGATWGYSHLWNTETGAFVKFLQSGTTVKTFTEAQQADAMRFYFRTPNLSPRITRLYVYCFFDGSTDDSGVIRTDKSAPRSAYYSVRDRLQ